jgi:hypothetical protein
MRRTDRVLNSQREEATPAQFTCLLFASDRGNKNVDFQKKKTERRSKAGPGKAN